MWLYVPCKVSSHYLKQCWLTDNRTPKKTSVKFESIYTYFLWRKYTWKFIRTNINLIKINEVCHVYLCNLWLHAENYLASLIQSHIDGCSITNGLAMEILQSCTKPSTFNCRFSLVIQIGWKTRFDVIPFVTIYLHSARRLCWDPKGKIMKWSQYQIRLRWGQNVHRIWLAMKYGWWKAFLNQWCGIFAL